MTTLKEYKAMMEGATDAPWFISHNRYSENNSFVICANDDNYHSISEVRNGADDEEYGGIDKERNNAQFIVESRNIAPELIRVIELAEEALKSCYFRDHDEMDYDVDLVDSTLSKIRKLKGE